MFANSLNFYENGKTLEPLRYSSGKSQLDTVNEILEVFESGNLCFLHGVVGSGKSVILIRTGLELGRSVIAVPTIPLSHQYARDYEGGKYFLKPDGSKARIRVLKGRDNFQCLWLKRRKRKPAKASSRRLPCTRPLEEGERRINALSECPRWGFIFPASHPIRINRVVYEGLSIPWAFCWRSYPPCDYYRQYFAYVDADVLVMNTAKFMIEVGMGRLPRTPLVAIDEADLFLDSLRTRVTIGERQIKSLATKLGGWAGQWVSNSFAKALADRVDPIDFAKKLVGILWESDIEEDLLWRILSILKQPEEVVVIREEKKLVYIVPDPKPVLQRLIDKLRGKILLAGATLQSPETLEEVFGIDPVIVRGETKWPGELVQRKIGSELEVNEERWKDPLFRDLYSNARDKILNQAPKPAFCPVHSMKYLPEGFPNLSEVERIERGGISYSTKWDRGMDLKGMRSVIVLKYPFADLQDRALQATRERLGEKRFWLMYRDMARREFIQQIGRVMRSPDTKAEFWSPDLLAHRFLEKYWEGKIIS